MPWTSFPRGYIDAILQSVCGVPRSKTLARDGAAYALFALFFYFQSHYDGAYVVCLISVFLCLIATAYVNLRDEVAKYVPLALNAIEVLGVVYYAWVNEHYKFVYSVGIAAPVYFLIVMLNLLPR